MKRKNRKSPKDTKKKIKALKLSLYISTPSTLLQMVEVMKIVLSIIKEKPSIKLLKLFIKYLKSEYGCFSHNEIQHI